jgi:hypothetical protein
MNRQTYLRDAKHAHKDLSFHKLKLTIEVLLRYIDELEIIVRNEIIGCNDGSKIAHKEADDILNNAWQRATRIGEE